MCGLKQKFNCQSYTPSLTITSFHLPFTYHSTRDFHSINAGDSASSLKPPLIALCVLIFSVSPPPPCCPRVHPTSPQAHLTPASLSYTPYLHCKGEILGRLPGRNPMTRKTYSTTHMFSPSGLPSAWCKQLDLSGVIESYTTSPATCSPPGLIPVSYLEVSPQDLASSFQSKTGKILVFSVCVYLICLGLYIACKIFGTGAHLFGLCLYTVLPSRVLTHD